MFFVEVLYRNQTGRLIRLFFDLQPVGIPVTCNVGAFVGFLLGVFVGTMVGVLLSVFVGTMVGLAFGPLLSHPL